MGKGKGTGTGMGMHRRSTSSRRRVEGAWGSRAAGTTLDRGQGQGRRASAASRHRSSGSRGGSRGDRRRRHPPQAQGTGPRLGTACSTRRRTSRSGASRRAAAAAAARRTGVLGKSNTRRGHTHTHALVAARALSERGKRTHASAPSPCTPALLLTRRPPPPSLCPSPLSARRRWSAGRTARTSFPTSAPSARPSSTGSGSLRRARASTAGAGAGAGMGTVTVGTGLGGGQGSPGRIFSDRVRPNLRCVLFYFLSVPAHSVEVWRRKGRLAEHVVHRCCASARAFTRAAAPRPLRSAPQGAATGPCGCPPAPLWTTGTWALGTPRSRCTGSRNRRATRAEERSGGGAEAKEGGWRLRCMHGSTAARTRFGTISAEEA